jgi:hypothetical protein
MDLNGAPSAVPGAENAGEDGGLSNVYDYMTGEKWNFRN